MSVNFTIQVNNVAGARDAINNHILAALEKCGAVAEGYAKTEVHVVTGNLRNSISHRTEAQAHTEHIGTDVEYAAAEELGPNHGSGHPYIRPALQNHIEQYRRIFENELRQV